MANEFDLRDVKWTTGWKGLPEAYVRIKTPGVTSVIGDMIPDPEMEEWIRKMGQETWIEDNRCMTSYCGAGRSSRRGR